MWDSPYIRNKRDSKLDISSSWQVGCQRMNNIILESLLTAYSFYLTWNFPFFGHNINFDRDNRRMGLTTDKLFSVLVCVAVLRDVMETVIMQVCL